MSDTSSNRANSKTIEEVDINEIPRVCCIDIEQNVLKRLRQSGFNTYSGTLGNKISVPNSHRGSSYQLLLNFDFPSNLHEYDIIILDLEEL